MLSFLEHRPPRSFWVVLRLIFFVLAIEFMEALEIALTVPILTSLHVDESSVLLFKNNFIFLFEIFLHPDITQWLGSSVQLLVFSFSQLWVCGAIPANAGGEGDDHLF